MSDPQRRLSVSYRRISDPKQAGGSGEDRQESDYRLFCERHNLTPTKEEFADRSSGYKDEHRRKGRLGELIEIAKEGRFERGTVIVVEAWDRLGRLRPDKQIELIGELLRTGVSIGVCKLDDVFTEEDFGSHKWTQLAVFVQLAFQESKQKGERVAYSWERRRQEARRNGVLPTGRLPAWLKLVNGKARLIPERVAVVQRIFALAAAGFGTARIAGMLDREKVPPFGQAIIKKGRVRSQFCGKWSRAYLILILRDRRVLGECQFTKLVGSPGEQTKVKDGLPVTGLFPPAVTPEVFLLAQAAVGKWTQGPKGERDRRHVNVFRGLLRHALDGEGFALNNMGTAAAPRLVLMNISGWGGRAKRVTWPYLLFEDALLRKLREVDVRDVIPAKTATPRKADVLRARLASIRHDLNGLKADLKTGYSKALASVLRDCEAAEEKVAAELQEELMKSAAPLEHAWGELPNLADLLLTADDPEALRLKLRQVLRRIIESIQVLIVSNGAYRHCVAQVWFAGAKEGSSRSYLLGYRPAGNNRKEEVSKPASFADAAGTPLDLRRREDAAVMEADLAAWGNGQKGEGVCVPKSLAWIPGADELDLRRREDAAELEARLLAVKLGGTEEK